MNARVVTCPQCGASVPWTAESKWRPFCSERCKVIDLGDWAAERQNDAAAQRLGDAAGAFAKLALNRVGLFEIGVGCIQYERLASTELVTQQFLEAGVPPLSQPGRNGDPILLGRVVINVEVFGFQNLKIELLVLNFVLPEVLRRGGRCAERGEATPEGNDSRG